MTSKDTAQPTTNTTETNFVCPLCGAAFTNIHDFSFHIKEHSDTKKRLDAEEEKRRKADQKKVDEKRLENLRKVYEDAAQAYLVAKEKYESEYGERYVIWPDILKTISDLHEGWDQHIGSFWR